MIAHILIVHIFTLDVIHNIPFFTYNKDFQCIFFHFKSSVREPFTDITFWSTFSNMYHVYMHMYSNKVSL